MSKIYFILSVFLSIGSISGIQGQEFRTNPEDQAQELGKVSWLRDYDFALQQANSHKKPVLMLFQEVPGCSTCRNYGNEVLSHPLIVDAIQNEFIPLVIYNNHKGEDSKILELYNEPSWNNPVVRVVDNQGKDILKRLNGKYSTASLSLYLKSALNYGNYKSPAYLNLLVDELLSKNLGTEEAYFQMYCFWSGEAAFGKIDGVIKTSPGFMNGAEVVKVNYEKDKISKKALIKYAADKRYSFVENPAKFRIDKDPQYYLKKTAYRHLPLLASQRSKINSALAEKEDPDEFLSPFQLELKKKLDQQSYKNPDSIYDMEFLKGVQLIRSKGLYNN